MKKILNEWKNFLKENSELEIDKEELLNKVRDIFFGAYNSWSDEYKKLHDKEFELLYSDLEAAVASDQSLSERDIETILGNANIGLTLYWSDESKRGHGSSEIVKKIIDKKLKILESTLSQEEQQFLKEKGMEQVLEIISADRGGMVFPTDLPVGLGIINGKKVQDAYMTTTSAINRHLIPVLENSGYVVQKRAPKQKRRAKKSPPLSPAEMLAQMKKFGRK
jgi:hypothetical protein